MNRRLHLIMSAAALALAVPVTAQTVDADRIESQASSRATMQQSWRAERQAMLAERDVVRAQPGVARPERQAQREPFRAQREAMAAQRGAGGADVQAQREAFRAQRQSVAAERNAGEADVQAQREAFRRQREAVATQQGGTGLDDWRARREAMRAQREAVAQGGAAQIDPQAQRDAIRARRAAEGPVSQSDAGLPEAGPARDAELQRRGADFRERLTRSQEARTAAGREAGIRPDPRIPADVLERQAAQVGARDLRRLERADERIDRRDDRRDWRADRRSDVRDDRRYPRQDFRRDRRWNDAWAQRGWDQRWAQQRFDRFGRPFDWNRGRRYFWGANLDPRFGFGSQWFWDPSWSYDPSWYGAYGYYDGSRFRDGFGYGVRAEDLVRSDPIIGRWALIRHDRDRSGWLGPSETAEAARDLRRFADLNGDGRISDREYRIALDRLQELADSRFGDEYDDDYDRY